jgi:hypothetical protein
MDKNGIHNNRAHTTIGEKRLLTWVYINERKYALITIDNKSCEAITFSTH